ncbi:hypothetical protein KUTeg_015572 [Tegillarca granosa]|uniref:Putative nuclease HARBI1 n=1 Tax=Tegillarca granosa TaxID=220873 RepID=A0ABQ9EQJ1_TEGGR|nr:hypothetical protein KUTeg_015572 [Tegillarca granosa]
MATVLRLLERLEDMEHNRNVRRVFVDRQNPLECLGDEEIFVRYRFCSKTIFYITDLVSDRLMHPTRRSLPLTPLLQVLVFLRFLASGAFHLLIADSVNISKATADRCIRRVGEAISSLAGQFIVFPTGNGIMQRKSGFYAVAGFPNVIGCIDGTQVRITKPKFHEKDFVNRKGFHSLNVQVSIYQHELDKLANIYNKPFNCLGEYNGMLLGDSGYACKPYLMTPYYTTDEACKERYNTALCRTRVLIEQTFGILKRRFASLHFGLRTNPERACIYVIDAVILHNIGILQKDVVRIDPLEDTIANDPIYHVDNDSVGKCTFIWAANAYPLDICLII